MTLAGRRSLSLDRRALSLSGAPWPRTLVVAGAAAVLAYGATRIFVIQPAAGAVVLAMLAMAAAQVGTRPGPALAVGVIAAVWNDVVNLPHALAGFLGPALVIELWTAFLRARPRLPLRPRVVVDLCLMSLALGSPVAIGFAAGPGYVDLDAVPEFRRYIVDLTAIGLAYLGLLAAAAFMLGRGARWLRARRQRRRAYTEDLAKQSAERSQQAVRATTSLIPRAPASVAIPFVRQQPRHTLVDRPPRTIDEIDTPAAIIDLDLVKQNIKTLEDFVRFRPVHTRPHAKTHKNPAIGRLQVEAGAVGLTCAKVGEAEAMVDGGIEDVLIANQVVGPIKIERMCRLAHRARVSVEVDDPANVDEISAAAQRHGVTIGVVVEIDVGGPRAGVPPHEPALALARRIMDRPGLEFTGLMAYEGHTVGIEDWDERNAAARAALAPVIETRELCESEGIPVREVTGGATNTFDITGTINGWTELQAGTYVTMDAWFRPHAGHAFTQAFWILTSVTSRAKPGYVHLDGGRKSIAFEPSGFPVIDDPEGLEIEVVAEEHLHVKMLDGAPDLRPGDQVRVTPWHGCGTFNLHDTLYVLQDDEVVDIWPISGRGRFT
ncbi:MAG: DSD1 family PLP-dependent enzyme [Chloroflexi bacterium]|nr:DSD1 family PLP-dependent enzyme [Chloroflexota bacterium]